MLTEFLDQELRVAEISDSSVNGLQVANTGEINKIALAVDASQAAFEKAREERADMLIVHHGLLWEKPVPLTGLMYERVKTLIQNDICLYAAHLPLDLHPELGNNAQITQLMNWPEAEDFGEYHGSVIGKAVTLNKEMDVEDLIRLLKEKLDTPLTAWTFGSRNVRKLGIVSGGGLGMLQEAVDGKFDVFITGEPGHSHYWTAREAGIHVIFGGHYATETLGVKAVGRLLEKKWGMETVFIDLPTGL